MKIQLLILLSLLLSAWLSQAQPVLKIEVFKSVTNVYSFVYEPDNNVNSYGFITGAVVRVQIARLPLKLTHYGPQEQYYQVEYSDDGSKSWHPIGGAPVTDDAGSATNLFRTIHFNWPATATNRLFRVLSNR